MPGSDQMINYQIRPAKSVERKMLCDLIKEIQVIEGNRELRYIGLGAKYFADFLLFHNEFGITDMISIEAEVDRQIRYEYNKPLKCIEMRYGLTTEVLPQISNYNEKINLVWLDYDDVFSEYMMYDIETLCRNLDIGSMFFISCNCFGETGNRTEKMEAFKDNVGSFFDETIDKEFYTNNKIPFVIRNIINKQINKTIDMRNRLHPCQKIEFLQLLFLKYKDGVPMLTFGGILVDGFLKEKIGERDLFGQLTYLSNDEKIFVIEIPRLTNREIQIILKNIPLSKDEYDENRDSFYGITYSEIQKFEKIYRYYPYYVEGQFNT